MIPVKDIIPPRSTPVVSLGIQVAASLDLLFQLWQKSATGPRSLALLINMAGLWIFADNVEDRLGHWRFAGFFVVCHTAGIVARGLVDPLPATPIGLAAGAVAGVLGAYFVMYPRSKVLMLAPMPLQLLEVPAVVFLAAFVTLHAAGGGPALVEVVAGLCAGGLLGSLLKRPVVW